MKVFISWSGNKSREVAGIIKWWLGKVHPAVRPWLSTSEIQAGDRWAAEIEMGLEGAVFGIICITPQNINSRWINYEAGAISRQVDGVKTKVAAMLIDYSSPTELDMPLSQFNAVLPTNSGFEDLALSINSALEDRDRRDVGDLIYLNGILWEELSRQLDAINVIEPDMTPRKRADSELLEELLIRVRGIDAYINKIVSEAKQKSQTYSDNLGKTLRENTVAQAQEAGDGQDEKSKILKLATQIVLHNLPGRFDSSSASVAFLDNTRIMISTPVSLSVDEKKAVSSALLSEIALRDIIYTVMS
jgi:hypothetical protein